MVHSPPCKSADGREIGGGQDGGKENQMDSFMKKMFEFLFILALIVGGLSALIWFFQQKGAAILDALTFIPFVA